MLKQTIKNLLIENDVVNISNAKDIGFEQFTEIIKNENMINKYYIFFKEMENMLNEDNFIKPHHANIFLSSYVICCFPKIVLINIPLSSKDLELKKLSLILIKNYEEIIKNEIFDLNNLLIFYKQFTNYITFFIEWKNQDYIKQILPFVNSYHQLEETKKLVEKEKMNTNANIANIEYFISKIIEQQKKLINHVQNIAGVKGLEFLHIYKPPNITVDEKIYKEIEKTVKRAYWDKFQEDLSKNDYKLIPMLLYDVKQKIFKLIPSRHDLHLKINEEIDIHLIEQMINNDAMTGDSVYNITKVLCNYIEMFQAPVDDKNFKEWMDNFNNLFMKPDVTYSELLPTFFKSIFTRLEKMEQQIMDFRDKHIV